jgi:hypothetical protein
MAATRDVHESPRYDAFVVRLWREAATGSCLRAEVEHVGSGVRVRAAAVPTAWVLRQIVAHLRASPSPDAATTGDQRTAAAKQD